MAFVEVPRQYKYGCDVCGEVHVQTNAAIPYAENRPAGWSHLRLYHGVPTTRVDWLLCIQCTGAAIPALDKFKEVNSVNNDPS